MIITHVLEIENRLAQSHTGLKYGAKNKIQAVCLPGVHS